MIPMSHYKHFTTKEREKILFFLAQEKTISFIAKELQRDKSLNRPPKVRPKI